MLPSSTNLVKRNEPFSDYLSNDAVSQSQLKYLDRSPAHLRELVDTPEPETLAQILGTALHCRVLDPDAFGRVYETPSDCSAITKARTNCARMGTKKSGGSWYCSQHYPGGELDDVRILSLDEDDSISNMNAALYCHKDSKKFLSKMVKDSTEVSLYFKHPRHDFFCKARPDLLLEQQGIIVDFKTTVDSGLDSFSRDILKYGYYRQAAWYLEAARICLPKVKWTNFVIISVEKKRPYAVSVNNLSDYYINIGEIELERLASIYADCSKKNEWPGYEGINNIDPPEWLLRKYEKID